MPRIAFATCAELPALDADDRHVLAPLRRLGIEVCPAVWNDPAVRWGEFDAVVLRSCWDYDRDPRSFLDWLARLEQLDAPVHNPPAVARWNVDKSHLAGIAREGHAIIPTVWVPRAADVSLGQVAGQLGFEELVVKPTISLSANGTWRVSAREAEANEARWREQLAGAGLMVQRFLPEIATSGEWSLVFLAGEYSHACLKLPAAGDFRVQTELGGSRRREDPDPALIELARRILAAAPGPQLYARVDGVVVQGEFRLMELELVDPQLYLEEAPEAAQRFAELLQGLVKG